MESALSQPIPRSSATRGDRRITPPGAAIGAAAQTQEPARKPQQAYTGDAGKDAEKYGPLPTLGWERAYRSGDLVRQHAGGNLEVTGRVKDVIHRGGETIPAADLEEHFYREGRRILGLTDQLAIDVRHVEQAGPGLLAFLAGFVTECVKEYNESKN